MLLAGRVSRSTACRDRMEGPGRALRRHSTAGAPDSLHFRKPAVVFLVAVAVGFGSLSYSRQSRSVNTIVLRGATLIDGLGNAPMSNATVIIEGDRIQSIVAGRRTPAPPGAVEFDLSGKYIIPGLIDSHVHWGPWMGELYINHGVTSVLGQLNVSDTDRAMLESSLQAPRMFHTGGRPVVAAEMSQDEIREAVREWMQRKPDIAWLPDFRTGNAAIYRRTAEEVHRAGFLVFSHAQNAPNAILGGLDVVEHVWGFAQALMSAADLQRFQQGQFPTWATFMNDWTRLDAVIQDAARRGVFLNPTLTYEWGGLSPSASRMEQEAYELFSNPELAYIPRNLAATLTVHYRQIKNFSARNEHMPMVGGLAHADLEQFMEGYRNVQQLVRRFVGAGGRIISGSDASSSAIPGLGLHHEMEMLVQAGLTPMQALQASTSWPAAMLAGRDAALGNRRVGSIQQGNLADMVILSANPLQDITNTKKIERVMKGGQFVPLGYHPAYYTFMTPPGPILMSTPSPEISSISPHEVTEGDPALELLIDGVGFTGTSVAKIDGIAVPTRFEGPRRLKASVAAGLIQHLPSVTLFPATISLPDRFGSPGPDQNVGVYGDHTLAVTVFNPTAEGGTSNSVSLILRAKWHREAGE